MSSCRRVVGQHLGGRVVGRKTAVQFAAPNAVTIPGVARPGAKINAAPPPRARVGR
jgi:hypothetical protein